MWRTQLRYRSQEDIAPEAYEDIQDTPRFIPPWLRALEAGSRSLSIYIFFFGVRFPASNVLRLSGNMGDMGGIVWPTAY